MSRAAFEILMRGDHESEDYKMHSTGDLDLMVDCRGGNKWHSGS